jgi:phospholipase/carboxylesterase
MHSKDILSAGRSIKEAGKVLIMIHGRGADARNILDLASQLNVADYALMAPQATNHTWYPHSFMAPPEQNEPWLSSALQLLKGVEDDLNEAGFAAEDIYFLGFSQGACLTLEYVARNAKNYGGIAAFTGGLIGDKLYQENYSGNFMGTPVFIATGNPDPHVPTQRVRETVGIIEEMNAEIRLQVYDGRPHTISEDEIKRANAFIFNP